MSSPTTTADAPGARCGRCGALLLPGAWRTLDLVDHVTHGRVRELVTHWPDGKGVEVRRCLCGHAVARMVAGALAR